MSATSPEPRPVVSPPLVALAGWAVPGGGYWLIGMKSRGVTIGVTVVLLFVFGLLVGGVRSLEVPFYNRLGQRARDRLGNDLSLLDEIRAKPWSIAQVMMGPVGGVGAWFSVIASRPDPNRPVPDQDDRQPGEREFLPMGDESHSRINEIAVLYTAVAGMLNLLAMIDSAHRAGRMQEEQK